MFDLLRASEQLEPCLPRKFACAQRRVSLCVFSPSRGTRVFSPSTAKAACLRRAVAAILHLQCVRPLVKWVMGSVRRWCARWGCEVPPPPTGTLGTRCTIATSKVIFKAAIAIAAAGRSGPESAALRTRAPSPLMALLSNVR